MNNNSVYPPDKSKVTSLHFLVEVPQAEKVIDVDGEIGFGDWKFQEEVSDVSTEKDPSKQAPGTLMPKVLSYKTGQKEVSITVKPKVFRTDVQTRYEVTDRTGKLANFGSVSQPSWKHVELSVDASYLGPYRVKLFSRPVKKFAVRQIPLQPKDLPKS